MKNCLKDAREIKGFSQEELSEISGISRATISKIENNERIELKTSTIAAISKALEKNPNDIFLF